LQVVRIPTMEGRRKELLRKGDTDTKREGETRGGGNVARKEIGVRHQCGRVNALTDSEGDNRN